MQLAVNQRVRVTGLNGRAELNGLQGTVLRFDSVKGRYAVRCEHASGLSEPVLIRRDNLVLEMAQGESSRAERRATLSAHAAVQHERKMEAAAHMSAVMNASSRDQIEDVVWDRVVEIQREVQVACNACDEGYPALLREAIEANDAPCWSRTAVEYANYLLGQSAGDGSRASLPSVDPVTEAKRLAGKVLKVHGCSGRCRDAALASAILAAEGPFSTADAELLLKVAADACPSLSGEEWQHVRERDAMHRELQTHWDTQTEERLRKQSSAEVAKLVADGRLG